MSENGEIYILPYTRIVGQDQLRLALELAYIEPRIGGVLISGERGTGKSTIVRAFAIMIYGDLPVTIPINVTEDRVVGGWQINELVHGEAKKQKGLLEEANGQLLYIDEVNLLDDHIVNIILDVTSTGVLVIQREGRNDREKVQFTLVGTMNPEEGNLRPQLLDRFGLMVGVTTETNPTLRRKILRAVLDFDDSICHALSDQYRVETRIEVEQYRNQIEVARKNLYTIEVPQAIADCCATLAYEFKAEGHRGERLMVLASRAYAAKKGDLRVNREHIQTVAPLVLQHRRLVAKQLNHALWSEEDDRDLNNLLAKFLVDHE